MALDEIVIRVVIADDHPVFRAGLRATFVGADDLEIVGEAGTAEEAVAIAERVVPDVVIMDLKMPGIGGVEATRLIATRRLGHVLVMSMYEDDTSVLAAMRAGARGYVLKGAGGPETLAAVRAVAAGATVLGPSVRGGTVAAQDRRHALDLTEREFQVLDLVARGLTNSAIAERLFLSEKTVRNHVSAVFGKLGVTSRAEAVARARDAGLGGATGG